MTKNHCMCGIHLGLSISHPWEFQARENQCKHEAHGDRCAIIISFISEPGVLCLLLTLWNCDRLTYSHDSKSSESLWFLITNFLGERHMHFIVKDLDL